MSYTPDIITPEFALLASRVDFSPLKTLKYPQDRAQLRKAPLQALQVWFAAQDPQVMIDLAQDRDFVRFWKWHYLVPLKLKRLLYVLKFW